MTPALLRAARPLGTPLTVSGLTGRAAELVKEAAHRARRPLFVAPAGPRRRLPAAGARCPAPPWRRRSPPATSRSARSGTVTYRDGDDLWAFGHPFEGPGRRALFLQDAYVYRRDPEPARHPGLRRDHLQARLGGRQRAVGPSTSDKADAIAGKVGCRARRRSRSTSSPGTAPGRRSRRTPCSPTSATSAWAPASPSSRPLGLTQAVGRLMRDFGPRDAPHVHPHPRARAAQADRLLQPLLLGGRGAQRPRRRPATSSTSSTSRRCTSADRPSARSCAAG